MRARDLSGAPVVDGRTGGRLGRVREVLIDPVTARLAGFRLRHGGLLDRRWRVAHLEDVVSVSSAAIVVRDALALREDEPQPAWTALGRHHPLVVDAHGAQAGRVVDAQVDPHSGRLVALLVAPSGQEAHERRPPAAVPADELVAADGGRMILSDAGSARVRGDMPAPPDQ